MTIKLTRAQEQFIRKRLAKGDYDSADQLVAHALKVFKRVEEILPSAEDDLQREIDLGLQDIEQGRVSDWNVAEMKRELLATLRKVS